MLNLILMLHFKKINNFYYLNHKNLVYFNQLQYIHQFSIFLHTFLYVLTHHNLLNLINSNYYLTI